MHSKWVDVIKGQRWSIFDQPILNTPKNKHPATSAGCLFDLLSMTGAVRRRLRLLELQPAMRTTVVLVGDFLAAVGAVEADLGAAAEAFGGVRIDHAAAFGAQRRATRRTLAAADDELSTAHRAGEGRQGCSRCATTRTCGFAGKQHQCAIDTYLSVALGAYP